jgi:hypothetical protein
MKQALERDIELDRTAILDWRQQPMGRGAQQDQSIAKQTPIVRWSGVIAVFRLGGEFTRPVPICRDVLHLRFRTSAGLLSFDGCLMFVGQANIKK